MRSTDVGDLTCPVARAIGDVGDPWTLMIVRELFLGSHRFDQFEAQVRASPILITARLRALEANGIIAKRSYSARPLRHEYHLTEKGLDLWPLMVALKHWGDRWGGFKSGPPAAMRHKACGHVTALNLVCDCCGQPISARDVVIEPGRLMSDERDALMTQKRARDGAKARLRRGPVAGRRPAKSARQP